MAFIKCYIKVMTRRLIHTKLINLNGVRECITKRLTRLESLRDKVKDSQRKKLEIEIEQCKTSVKFIEKEELDLRMEL